ncbi:FxLD family lanthipeptide [Actinomadura atramentaria]|uniref:FxLD family lanthipeptide n=1 Tax=Actinomadura atramentaria TaxID=1990 RepID=UPI00039ECA1E|nr:FxLD family lanthipeptide [Actinomadura atramentaria]
MDYPTNSTASDTAPSPLRELNLRLVDVGPVASAHATSTDDDCGSGDTGSSACTTTSN